jgi:hypothetical protein
MKPRPIAFFLLLSGMVFGLAAWGTLTVASHLHAPSTFVLRAPELESIVNDDLKLRQKLRDEENAAEAKILTIVGAHFQVCILLAVSSGIQIVAGLALLRGERKRGRELP